MSQGDAWIWRKTGERGIEVQRNADYLRLALIDDAWPFPQPPIWVLRKECKRAPMSYYHGQVLDEPAFL